MKRFGCYLLIAAAALITGAVLFLGILSIWIGISQQDSDGFWTPLISGSFCSVLVLYLFLRFSSRLFRHTKRADSLGL